MKIVKTQSGGSSELKLTPDEVALLRLFRAVDKTCQQHTLCFLDFVASKRPAKPSLRLVPGGAA